VHFHTAQLTKSASTVPNFHPNGWAEDPRHTQDPYGVGPP